MRLFTENDVAAFQKALNKCRGAVWLEDKNGSKINLKSKLSQYVAIGKMLTECGDKLELYCSLREDRAILLEFIGEHKDVV